MTDATNPNPNPNTDPDRMARLRRESVRCVTHHEACACRELAHAEAEAEVERSRAIVRTVAAMDDRQIDRHCMYCLAAQLTQDEEESGLFIFGHMPWCPVAQARALLAATPHDTPAADAAAESEGSAEP